MLEELMHLMLYGNNQTAVHAYLLCDGFAQALHVVLKKVTLTGGSFPKSVLRELRWMLAETRSLTPGDDKKLAQTCLGNYLESLVVEISLRVETAVYSPVVDESAISENVRTTIAR